MDTSARITGYFCLFLLLIAVAAGVSAFRREATQAHRVVRVHFPELGTLIADDPVTREGVPIGKVRSLALDPDHPEASVVEIELFHRGFIPADSRFVDFNYSLMGSRIVVLVPGHSSLPMDETRVQEGMFAAGIAETVHRVDDLLNLVLTLRAETVRLFTGSQAPLAPGKLQGRLENAITRLHGVAGQAASMGKDMRSGVDALVLAEAGASRDLRASRASLNPAWKRMNGIVGTTLSFERGLESAFGSLEKLLASLQDSGAVHKLLYQREMYDDLESALHGLQAVLKVLRDDGLANTIQFRRNVHLIRHESR